MLFIKTSAGRELTWHIGDQLPERFDQETKEYDHYQDVCLIQADGDELYYIKERFQNLPMAVPVLPSEKGKFVAARIVRWRRDLAQFIYDNLT